MECDFENIMACLSQSWDQLKSKKEEKTKKKENYENKKSGRRMGNLGWRGRSSEVGERS